MEGAWNYSLDLVYNRFLWGFLSLLLLLLLRREMRGIAWMQERLSLISCAFQCFMLFPVVVIDAVHFLHTGWVFSHRTATLMGRGFFLFAGVRDGDLDTLGFYCRGEQHYIEREIYICEIILATWKGRVKKKY